MDDAGLDGLLYWSNGDADQIDRAMRGENVDVGNGAKNGKVKTDHTEVDLNK